MSRYPNAWYLPPKSIPTTADYRELDVWFDPPRGGRAVAPTPLEVIRSEQKAIADRVDGPATFTPHTGKMRRTSPRSGFLPENYVHPRPSPRASVGHGILAVQAWRLMTIRERMACVLAIMGNDREAIAAHPSMAGAHESLWIYGHMTYRDHLAGMSADQLDAFRWFAEGMT